MPIGRLQTVGFWAVFLVYLGVPAQGAKQADPPRPESWAQPVEVGGVRNLHKVSDDLYRSAQPKAESLQGRADLGITTVLSVRFFHSGRRQ